MARLASLMKRFDTLKGNERALLTVVVVLVLLLLWDSMLMGPTRQRQRILNAELEGKQQQVGLLQEQARVILAAHQADPDAATRQRLAAVEASFSQVRQQLRERTSHLIAPEKMAEVLETVLKKSTDLNFVGMHGLGVKSLLQAEADASSTARDEDDFHDAYLHGLEIVFEGGYLETRDYLRRLEQLPWVFYWKDMDYQVSEYPQARTTIRVYTLSLDRAWIGI